MCAANARHDEAQSCKECTVRSESNTSAHPSSEGPGPTDSLGCSRLVFGFVIMLSVEPVPERHELSLGEEVV